MGGERDSQAKRTPALEELPNAVGVLRALL